MSWAFSPLLPGSLSTPAGNLGYVKIWMGSSWICKPVKVWNGSQWVIKPAKWYNTATTSWITPFCGGAAEPPAPATRAFVGVTGASTSTGTAIVVPTPLGAISGDLLIVHLQGNATVSHNLPAGWTSRVASVGGQQIFSRTHDGVSTSYTFTTGTSVAQGATLIAYRGYAFGTAGAWSAAAVNPISDAITVPANDSVVLNFIGNGTAPATYSMPAGWTSFFELGVNRAHQLFQRDALAASGTLGAVTSTRVTGTTDGRSVQVSLSPV